MILVLKSCEKQNAEMLRLLECPLSQMPAKLTGPPQPSIAFTIDAWAWTSKTGLDELSRSQICSCPSHTSMTASCFQHHAVILKTFDSEKGQPVKFPVASLRSTMLDAPNVPHLKLLGFCRATKKMGVVTTACFESRMWPGCDFMIRDET
jgi:hypothetical protein